MINDRFNEMYLKLSQAKNFEKKGNTEAALKGYITVIEEYKPVDSQAYERACALLMQRGRYADAKKYAQLAIEKLKNGDISGAPAFFVGILSKVDERSGANKKIEKSANIPIALSFADNKFMMAIIAIILALAVILSLPDKIFKLLFIVFGSASILFVLEIAKDLKERIKVKLKGVLLFIFVIIAIYGAIKMPKADWQNFFQFPSFGEVQNSGDLEKSISDESKQEDKLKDAEISSDDLSTLKSMAETEFELHSYSIKISESKIKLDLKVKKGCTVDRSREIASSLLKNLNLIKGFESEQGEKLGALYKKYSAEIRITDLSNSTMSVGDSSKRTQKINWF